MPIEFHLLEVSSKHSISSQEGMEQKGDGWVLLSSRLALEKSTHGVDGVLHSAMHAHGVLLLAKSTVCLLSLLFTS